MRIILSTSNIIGRGPSVLARSGSKSNAELIASLRANFDAHRPSSTRSFHSWTSQSADGEELHIPAISPTPGLVEDRSSYDITVKLFYLPHVPAEQRCEHTHRAVNSVLAELNIPFIDLLIVSFPGISFDADDESDETLDNVNGTISSKEDHTTTYGIQSMDVIDQEAENMESLIQTWHTLEILHNTGVIRKLGLSEFGTQRLARILEAARIPPSVNQINVRDCCVVPRPLIVFAKERKIELLTHNDCTDILPTGTLRELLGPSERGYDVLAASASTSFRKDKTAELLSGEVLPLWVAKYTAVVMNRGVVENKGYFAAAELSAP